MTTEASPGGIRVEAATPAHLDGLAALFLASSSPCYCRFWHFEGTNNAWLERCAVEPEQNRREFAEALGTQGAEANGVVAIEGGAGTGTGTDTIVGWMKVAPVGVMTKAYERRLYRRLPCFGGDREGVFLVGCALVHPARRRHGVAVALVEGAVRLAPAWGARALEAMPRCPKEAVSDEEMWTGPASVFRRNGFVEVHAFEPYPVLRRELEAGAADGR